MFLKRGTGKIIINNRNLDDYFGRKTGTMIVRQPLECIGTVDQFDINVTVRGGDISGQAGATLLGQEKEDPSMFCFPQFSAMTEFRVSRPYDPYLPAEYPATGPLFIRDTSSLRAHHQPGSADRKPTSPHSSSLACLRLTAC